MEAAPTALDDMDRIIPFRDCASAAGCSERTLETRLKAKSIPIVKISARQKGLRLGHYRTFLKACEA